MTAALNTEAVLIAAGLNLLVGIAAFLKKSLTPGGSVAGILLGTGIYLSGGFVLWAVMGAFFFSSTLLSSIRKRQRSRIKQLHGKGGRRDAAQVAANGGAGFLAAVLYGLTGHMAFLAAFIASFAEANADTWASELGILSRKPPVSILTGEALIPGSSGGVSRAGTIASVLGSGFIAAVYTGLAFFHAVPPDVLILQAAISTAAGFAGALLDSVLGATLQGRFSDRITGEYTEDRWSEGRENIIRGGFAPVTNDSVNFISTVVAAVTGGVLYLLLSPLFALPF